MRIEGPRLGEEIYKTEVLTEGNECILFFSLGSLGSVLLHPLQSKDEQRPF